MIRGEEVVVKIKGQKVTAAAIVVDTEGNILYRIVTTNWTKMVIVLLIVMMSICTLLSIMVYWQNTKINQLETRQDAEDTRNARPAK